MPRPFEKFARPVTGSPCARGEEAMPSRTHNPEKRAWGKSHKKGGERVRALREAPEKPVKRVGPTVARQPHIEHKIHIEQRADYPASCKCGALLCTCCHGGSSPQGPADLDDEDGFFGSVVRSGCTLCTGRPWFEVGEFSDVVTCERKRPKLSEVPVTPSTDMTTTELVRTLRDRGVQGDIEGFVETADEDEIRELLRDLRVWANPPKVMFWDFNTGRHTYSEAEAKAWREDGGDVRKYLLAEGGI